MKIDAFATLDAVLRCGSFAAAAQDINLTPSAVSMQMKQLEAYVGQPLFDRSGLQVRPTPLAHEVCTLLRGPLQGLDALRKRTTLTVEGTVRLGLLESMQAVLLPGTMRLLRQQHARLELKPSRGRSATLTVAVKAGELDGALVAQPEKGGSSRLRWQPLMRRELVLVAPPSATESSVAALFRQHEWIRYDRDTVTGGQAARFVNTHVRDKRSSLEFDSAPAIVAMVSAGLGVSVLHIADPGLLQVHPVRVVRLGRGAPVVQFSLVTRKADDDDRPLLAVRDALSSAASDAQRAWAAATAAP